MKQNIVIYWCRQDLRLSDNPAFSKAVQTGLVLPIYILDDASAGKHCLGAASRSWLHHSLHAFNKILKGHLAFYKGRPQEIFSALMKNFTITAVYWNRCYEPWAISRDAELKKFLIEQGIEVQSFNASLLWEPWEVLKADGTPYSIYSYYYRQSRLNVIAPRAPLVEPQEFTLVHDSKNSLTLEELELLPNIPWDKKIEQSWNVGEVAAKKALQKFLKTGLSNYKEGRNFPADSHVSRLSPHLHFGEISPNQVWYAAKSKEEGDDLESFLGELAWREFSYYLLYHFPTLPIRNLQKKFDHFPWQENTKNLQAWQQGRTGYPMIDAGMRELWQTGYMHNRVRMIVASFLTKNLLLPWQKGAQWFWDCLVDADLASNSASWQWVAGCGTDAAPYFRIFNPVTQSRQFDPSGKYLRQYLPELQNLPDRYLHAPWEAPLEILESADIILGETYPLPIVDLKLSRQKALEAFASLR